jgi:hypothetical protein
MARDRSSSATGVALLLGLLTAGLLFVALGANNIARVERLRHVGVHTTADVLGTSTSYVVSGGNAGVPTTLTKTYNAEVRYEVGGVDYTGQITSADPFDATTTVVYNRRHPSEVEAANFVGTSLGIGIYVLCFGILLIAGTVAVVATRGKRAGTAAADPAMTESTAH